MPYKDPEKQRACHTKWQAENLDKVKAYQAKYYAENLDKEKARKAKYRAENLDKVKARNATWRAKNPDKEEALRLRSKYNRLTIGQRDAMFVQQGGRCSICPRADVSLIVEHDHGVEHDRSSRHVRSLACRSCNGILGQAKDDPRRLAHRPLHRAYLEHHSFEHADLSEPDAAHAA